VQPADDFLRMDAGFVQCGEQRLPGIILFALPAVDIVVKEILFEARHADSFIVDA